jgi:hypothetical protein
MIRSSSPQVKAPDTRIGKRSSFLPPFFRLLNSLSQSKQYESGS